MSKTTSSPATSKVNLTLPAKEYLALKKAAMKRNQAMGEFIRTATRELVEECRR